MNRTRIWAVACGASVVAVLAGAWFLGVQPQLDSASAAATSVTAADAQNQATQIKITRLSRTAAKSESLHAQDAVLLKSVPTILKPNTFIRRVNELAELDGVVVSSVNIGAGAAYTTPVSSPGDGTSVFAKTNPIITASNFTAVPVTVQVNGTADAALQFAHDVQNDQRVFAISGLQTTAVTGTVTAIFSGYIYVLKR